MEKTMPYGLRSDLHIQGFRLIDYQYEPGDYSEFHKDKYPKLSIVLQGQLRERSKTQDIWASPMSVVIKPPDALHADIFGPTGARIISIAAPDQHAWPEHLDPTFFEQYAWFHGTPTIHAVSEFLREFAQLEEAPALEEALIRLIAGLSSETQDRSKSPPQWLQQVAEQLADCCDETIRIRELARASGVHPVYLARVFRRYFHCNPKQYQFHFRLRRALDHLTRQKPLVQVALDNGFADQSHFTRLFKSTTGMSPGRFRKMMRDIHLNLNGRAISKAGRY